MKHMKKYLFSVVALMLVIPLAVGLAACGAKEDKTKNVLNSANIKGDWYKSGVTDAAAAKVTFAEVVATEGNISGTVTGAYTGTYTVVTAAGITVFAVALGTTSVTSYTGELSDSGKKMTLKVVAPATGADIVLSRTAPGSNNNNNNNTAITWDAFKTAMTTTKTFVMSQTEDDELAEFTYVAGACVKTVYTSEEGTYISYVFGKGTDNYTFDGEDWVYYAGEAYEGDELEDTPVAAMDFSTGWTKQSNGTYTKTVTDEEDSYDCVLTLTATGATVVATFGTESVTMTFKTVGVTAPTEAGLPQGAKDAKEAYLAAQGGDEGDDGDDGEEEIED